MTLDIVTVGKWKNFDQLETYEAWQQEAHRIVRDVPAHIRLSYGQYTWYEGRLYSRGDGNFFEGFSNVGDTTKPDILCPCGSVAFTLRYGEYELRASCVACSTEDVVYDG